MAPTAAHRAAMATKRLRYAADFHAQASEFSLVSLPDSLLTSIVEQDGRCDARPASGPDRAS